MTIQGEQENICFRASRDKHIIGGELFYNCIEPFICSCYLQFHLVSFGYPRIYQTSFLGAKSDVRLKIGHSIHFDP